MDLFKKITRVCKFYFTASIIVSLILLIVLTGFAKPHPRVLIFSKTKGFHHSSIPTGVAAIQKLGQENGFDTDTTTNADWFNDQTLKKYAAVVFVSTTGDLFI